MEIAVLALCVHRNISVPTFISTLQLVTSTPGWDVKIEMGDALMCRVRSIVATDWLLRYKHSDVLVMTDDDFAFTPEGINSLVAKVRETKGIAAGVTPLRSGRCTAIVPFDCNSLTDEPWVDPAAPAEPIRWAGGLLAYHRNVFEKLSQSLPLLHKNDVIPPFYPFFMPMIIQKPNGGEYLSEDYACHERAGELGIPVHVQPLCQVQHLSEVLLSAQNMQKMRDFYRPVESREVMA